MKGFISVLSAILLVGCATTPNQLNSVNGHCDKVSSYDIDFSRFDEVAQQLSHATGCFIKADLSDVGNVKPNPVKGNMSIRSAIAVAIRGTELKIINQDKDSIEIGRK
ncbi:hypothetical protein [Shewanella dokdonensis]|uniref:Lipoprotein n=1 Tax=Shewanella dokdonensis TaxID=712036 RepID=A0ABX8DF32_9GAMM|nr:hypothetical protein [Shewanella dokdonensis]MCL1074886.1 hypothetical protein [Shewanella dokdonensis]QVK23343.1 hypothetical protein KHX94_00520 [Shewanella dokdonensis]